MGNLDERYWGISMSAVTLDTSDQCAASVWKKTSGPDGIPHFSLTAEHLIELHRQPPAYEQEIFNWRDSEDSPSHDQLNSQFGDYLDRRNHDRRRGTRAPWVKASE